MQFDKHFQVIERINQLNYDNGSVFTHCERCDAIAEILSDSSYTKINSEGLFLLYAKRSIEELPNSLILVSSHIDCVDYITRTFTENYSKTEIKGTFDNSITNSAIIELMLENSLPDNVVIAFTGDEEEDSTGACEVCEFLRSRRKHFSAVVLDVTDMGWGEECDFTVENDFFDESFGENIIAKINSTDSNWKFVPEDRFDIPDFIDNNRVIFTDALADESWEYDEYDIACFSFCLPVFGEMHSDEGVLARKSSYEKYIEVLRLILRD